MSELEFQRRHYDNNIQETRNNYEKALIEVELKNQEALDYYRERDQSWQIEKQVHQLETYFFLILGQFESFQFQDVLGEIKRLKDEASRFIAILSQEEEYEKCDQQLSPTKKQALTKEVESLQVIFEIFYFEPLKVIVRN